MKDVKIEVGKVYNNGNGTLTVIEYKRAVEVLVKHNDEYGHKMWTQAYRIRRGDVRNPFEKHYNGFTFTGYGYCKNLKPDTRKMIYSLWRCVVQRTQCSNATFKVGRRNTYQYATMCEYWYNFQNFCQYVVENKYFHVGWQLDKDLLVKGNKHYSPETCVFLPQQINGCLAIDYFIDNGLPIGVNTKPSGNFEAAISYRGKRKPLGTFQTPEEASEVYVRAKESYMKELALEYKDQLDPRAFEALMNWTVY